MIHVSIVQVIFLLVLGLWMFTVFCAFLYYRHGETTISLLQDKSSLQLFIEDRERMLKRSTINLSFETYMLLMAVVPPIASAVILLLTDNLMFALVILVPFVLIPELLLRGSTSQSEKEFEKNLVLFTDHISASLAAGYTLLKAMEEAANDKMLHPDMREYAKKFASELNMGVSVKDAFDHFAEETNSRDVQDLALSVTIQHRVGGSESEVIKEAGQAIHGRINMRKQIRSILTSSRLTVVMVSMMCPMMLAIFSFSMPEMMKLWFSSPQMTAAFCVIACIPVIGILVSLKMINSNKVE